MAKTGRRGRGGSVFSLSELHIRHASILSSSLRGYRKGVIGHLFIYVFFFNPRSCVFDCIAGGGARLGRVVFRLSWTFDRCVMR